MIPWSQHGSTMDQMWRFFLFLFLFICMLLLHFVWFASSITIDKEGEGGSYKKKETERDVDKRSIALVRLLLTLDERPSVYTTTLDTPTLPCGQQCNTNDK
jgi:hypothetical protein